jgi:phospholipase C
VTRKHCVMLLAAFGGAIFWLAPQLTYADGNLQKVNHIIVVMQENHSFDNYFGVLALAPGSPITLLLELARHLITSVSMDWPAS